MSLGSIVEEQDQYKLKPDGETLGTDNGMLSLESEGSDLSFIPHLEDCCVVERDREWRARNNRHDQKLLRKSHRALSSMTEPQASQVIDLTDKRPCKLTKFY